MTTTGYTRQSAATIVTGNTIQASDFNNEYNKIQDFADGTIGHDHSGGTGLGPKISLTGAVSGILPVVNGGTGIANNAASTITITGAYAIALTLSNTTALTLPTTGTLATLAGTETLTNKTITAPIISTISNTGTLTLPTSTDTLVGRDTTDTLTNKTLIAPNIGASIATSINKVVITAPATSATLTLADGSSLITSGGNSLTFTTTGSTSVTLPTSGTLLNNSNNLSELSSASTARTNLGLAIGSNVQAWDADLDTLAGLSSTGFAVRTGSNTWAQRTITAGTFISVSSGSGTSGNPVISWNGANLSDLTDAGISTATNGDMLYYSGGLWRNSHQGSPANVMSMIIGNSGTNPGFMPIASSDSNVTVDIKPKGTGGINLWANGAISVQANYYGGSGTPVNYLIIQNAGTGIGPNLLASGSDTNISLVVATKGTGLFNVQGNNATALQVGAAVSAVNYLSIAAGASGSDAVISAQNGGASTDGLMIYTSSSGGDITFKTNNTSTEALRIKASGQVKFSGSANFAANGIATVIVSNLGPAGITTATIKKWLTIIDSTGTTLYIPAWGA